MRVTNVARRLGVSPDWLRHLERNGRIPVAQRDRNGHRRYTEGDLERLREVLFGRSEEPLAR